MINQTQKSFPKNHHPRTLQAGCVLQTRTVRCRKLAMHARHSWNTLQDGDFHFNLSHTQNYQSPNFIKTPTIHPDRRPSITISADRPHTKALSEPRFHSQSLSDENEARRLQQSTVGNAPAAVARWKSICWENPSLISCTIILWNTFVAIILAQIGRTKQTATQLWGCECLIDSYALFSDCVIGACCPLANCNTWDYVYKY